MKFIGDLSVKDVSILKKYAKSKVVLEFGVGGSTMLFHQTASACASVETDRKWIHKTIKHLQDLQVEPCINYFILYDHFEDPDAPIYDVIFVDGLWNKRKEWAESVYKHLKEDGVILWHDTRRTKDKMIVKKFIKGKDVSVVWNEDQSNITVIRKDSNRHEDNTFKDLPYEDWNKVENKPKWKVNGDNKPTNWIELL